MYNFLLVFYDCSKFIVCISPELAFIFQPLYFSLSDIVASLKKIPCESVLDKSVAWGRFLNFDSERHLPWTLGLGVFTVFCDFPLYNVTFTLFMCLLSVQLFLNLFLHGNVNFRRVGSVCSPQCLLLGPKCCRRLDILNKSGDGWKWKAFLSKATFCWISYRICHIFWWETKKHFEAHRLTNVAKNGCGAEAFSVYVTRYSSAHLSDTLLELGSSKVVEAWRRMSGFLTGAVFLEGLQAWKLGLGPWLSFSPPIPFQLLCGFWFWPHLSLVWWSWDLPSSLVGRNHY